MNYLLTLDIATKTGWTCGEPGDPHFASGTHVLPKTGEDIGLFLKHYRNWLRGALEGVSLVVFEQPLMPSIPNFVTLRKLYSLAGLTELVCLDADVKCLELSAAKVKAFLGVRYIKGGPDLKTQMVDAVKQYGYDCATHDEADAIGLRLLTIHHMFPQHIGSLGIDLGLLGAASNG